MVLVVVKVHVLEVVVGLVRIIVHLSIVAAIVIHHVVMVVMERIVITVMVIRVITVVVVLLVEGTVFGKVVVLTVILMDVI